MPRASAGRITRARAAASLPSTPANAIQPAPTLHYPPDTSAVAPYPERFYIPPGVAQGSPGREPNAYWGNTLLWYRGYFGRTPLELTQAEFADLRDIDRTAISHRERNHLKRTLGAVQSAIYLDEHSNRGHSRLRTGTLQVPTDFVPPHTLEQFLPDGSWTDERANGMLTLMTSRASGFDPTPQIVIGHPPADERVRIVSDGRLVDPPANSDSDSDSDSDTSTYTPEGKRNRKPRSPPLRSSRATRTRKRKRPIALEEFIQSPSVRPAKMRRLNARIDPQLSKWSDPERLQWEFDKSVRPSSSADAVLDWVPAPEACGSTAPATPALPSADSLPPADEPHFLWPTLGIMLSWVTV